jgi:ribonuclease HII
MALAVDDLTRYENSLREQGFSRIAGVDEAGRGALAGPMFAAAVILPESFDADGIADSKMLTRRQREAAYERIVAEATAIALCRVTSAGIDRRGLHRSNLALLRRAVRSLPVEPDYVLTDAWPIRRLPVPTLSIKKGDAVTTSVAAASIVAKVERDRTMERYHRRFPEFGFDHNRGYGTAEHWEVLVRLGPTAIHRLSFRGVADPRPLDRTAMALRRAGRRLGRGNAGSDGAAPPSAVPAGAPVICDDGRG